MSTGTAEISPCGLYRYRLTRELGTGKPTAVFILLNPSTADAEQDDPTTKRCMSFAESWGCGRLWIVNLFGFRATKPADLWKVYRRDPREAIGPRCDYWIDAAIQRVAGHQRPIVVCGWGAHGEAARRAAYVLDRIRAHRVTPQALRITQGGHPGHPLYLKGDTELQEYSPR